MPGIAQALEQLPSLLLRHILHLLIEPPQLLAFSFGQFPVAHKILADLFPLVLGHFAKRFVIAANPSALALG